MSRKKQSVLCPIFGDVIAEAIYTQRENRAQKEIIETQQSIIQDLMHNRNIPYKRDYEKLRPYLDRTHENLLRIIDENPGLTYAEIKIIYEDRYHPICRVEPRIQELRASVKGWTKKLVETKFDKQAKRIRVYPNKVKEAIK